jgi:oligopeptide/dipeptide ABC transporter ATP-binding protein
VTITVRRGETLGIVGESGCGKTTVGRLLLGLYEPTEGRVLFNGRDIAGMEKEELHRLGWEMSVVFQDPYSSLDPRMSVQRIVSEPLKIHNLFENKAERQERVIYALERVGLRSEDMRRYPHQFSGGQRQRIAIARTLVLNPQLIILDEPVSALDVSIQAQVINLLVELQKEFHLTYIFIAHDLRVVEYISTSVAVMYLGKIMEMASGEEIYSRPRHPYTEALLSSVPMPNPKEKKKRITLEGDVPSPIHPPSGCRFHLRCRYRDDACPRVVPELEEINHDHYVACHFPLD